MFIVTDLKAQEIELFYKPPPQSPPLGENMAFPIDMGIDQRIRFGTPVRISPERDVQVIKRLPPF